MALTNSIKEKFHHENWPTPVFYAPLFLYYLYNSVKFRKFNYFTAVNPGLQTGGLCGFSKYESFKLLPEHVIPKTILLKNELYSEQQIGEMLEEAGLNFPLVVKPDQGERGFLVSKVDTLRELTETIGNKTLKIDFLIQEFAKGPLELGVFLIRQGKNWKVSSITSKDFLSVVGDGVKTIEELIADDSRSSKYFDSSKVKFSLKRVPELNEEVILEPIGNHCRGTKFVNECCKITDETHTVFNDLLKNVDGVNYCRLDLRASSWSSLLKGEFHIMEVNGVSAEPGHIYDPSMSLKSAYKDLFSHWSEMAVVAKEQIAKGSPTEKLSQTVDLVKTHMKRKQEFQGVKDLIIDVMGCKGLDLSLNPEVLLQKFSKEELLSNHKCVESAEGYERTVLFKNKEFEIVFCHWRSGDKSPVHMHPNTNCWFRCLDGDLVELRSMGQEQNYLKEGDLGHIEDSMGAHQMLNMSEGCAYTVHIYQTKKDK